MVASKFCEQCGKEMSFNAIRCPACGALQPGVPSGSESLIYQIAMGVFLGMLLFSLVSGIIWFVVIYIPSQ